MKKVFIAAISVLMLAACSKTEKAAGIGAAGGAVIGGLASGSWKGAAVGAAAGGAGGAVVGHISEREDRRDRNRWDRDCRYRDRYGREYIDRCR